MAPPTSRRRPDQFQPVAPSRSRGDLGEELRLEVQYPVEDGLPPLRKRAGDSFRPLPLVARRW